MKILMILLIACTLISCDSDDPLTQADCERITDPSACLDRGCVYQGGFGLFVECGGVCQFSNETEGFAGCFLSDTRIQEQMPTRYYRQVGDQYQIIELNSGIGNLTGWERGTPACVTCTWEWDN